MLKGINKQIIEIKCTNNEHFEKALLFVRSGCEEVSYAELLTSAEELTGRLGGGNHRRSGRIWLAAAACAALLMSAAAAVILLLV